MSVANPIAEIAEALRARTAQVVVSDGIHTTPASVGGSTNIPVTQYMGYVERFITPKQKESYYIVTFDIDQRDADCITVSSKQHGKLDSDELIRLSIMKHYCEIDDWDGEWYNLGPMEEYISDNYLDGFFYHSCNRFGFDDISIEGYDADKDEFYTMDIPTPSQLGIQNITNAYHQYFNCGEANEDED